MTPRGTIPGKVHFGDGFGRGRGRGIDVSIETDFDTLPDKGRRPQGDTVKGPNGEPLNTRRERFEIQITGGGTDGLYSWKRIHPTPAGDQGNADGGGGSNFDGGMPALEINYLESVPVGTNHMASPSEVGPFINFDSGGSGQTGNWIRITEATSSGGSSSWKGIVYINNGDGTWADGVEIRASFTPNGGTVFVSGRDYWATLNGTISENQTPRTPTDGVTTSGTKTVTSATAAFSSTDVGAAISGTGIPGGATIVSVESATSVTISANATGSGSSVHITITPVIVYPRYFSLGNDKFIFPACRLVEGVATQQCDKLLLPAPIEYTENVDCGTGEPL